MSSLGRLGSIADAGFSLFDNAKASLNSVSTKIDKAAGKLGDAHPQMRFVAKKAAFFVIGYALLAYSTHIIMGVVGENLFHEPVQEVKNFWANRSKPVQLAMTAVALFATAYLFTKVALGTTLIFGAFYIGWSLGERYTPSILRASSSQKAEDVVSADRPTKA